LTPPAQLDAPLLLRHNQLMDMGTGMWVMMAVMMGLMLGAVVLTWGKSLWRRIRGRSDHLSDGG
jgi:hypothetical protein